MLTKSMVLLLHATIAIAIPAARVEINGVNVEYEGTYQSEVEAFLAIPYGLDTSGRYRFKPPRPFAPTKAKTIKAQKPGPECPQQMGEALIPLYYSNVTQISEDCLHLNVWRPNGTKEDDKLPVMVFIHGAGLFGGSKDEITSQPPGLILESVANGLPVMAVNINYRLSIFGFAKSLALGAEGSLNAGLKDQRLALEWVKDNIGAFGGNSKQVTIYGQSSGGLSVGLQTLAYGASQPVPFQQIICESQALETALTGNVTNMAMQRVVDYVGCNKSSISSVATISCLRNLTMEDLLTGVLNTYMQDPINNLGDDWLPTVDGDFIPSAPSQLLAERRLANVTAMIGWCEDDANIFPPTTIQTANDTDNFVAQFQPGLTQANVQKLLSLYPSFEFTADPAANLSAEFFRSARIMRDIVFTCQPIHVGESLAAQGNAVYYYEQNQTRLTPILDLLGLPGVGVIHTSEMAYVFGNLSHYDINGYPFDQNGSDYALAKRESRSWSTFASMGRPSLQGHNTLQGWKPAYSKQNQTEIFIIGGPNEGLFPIDGPNSNPSLAAQRLRERCGFLNSGDVPAQLLY